LSLLLRNGFKRAGLNKTPDKVRPASRVKLAGLSRHAEAQNWTPKSYKSIMATPNRPWKLERVMPLSKDEIQQRRTLPVETLQMLDIGRIADSLEGIHDQLRNIHLVMKGEALKRGIGR
jgi:hypothetical protein